MNHISDENARSNVPLSQQYACGSDVSPQAVQNEITCIRLDGSNDQLIVAPVMTDPKGSGAVGSEGFMRSSPKAIWTSLERILFGRPIFAEIGWTRFS